MSNLTTLGKTVLLTTHYMDEAQTLADRVIVIARGAIVAEGTPEDIGGRDLDKTIVSFAAPADLDGLALAGHRDRRALPLRDGGRDPRPAPAHQSGPSSVACVLDALDVRKPSLEDVYLRLTADPTASPSTASPEVTR